MSSPPRKVRAPPICEFEMLNVSLPSPPLTETAPVVVTRLMTRTSLPRPMSALREARAPKISTVVTAAAPLRAIVVPLSPARRKVSCPRKLITSSLPAVSPVSVRMPPAKVAVTRPAGATRASRISMAEVDERGEAGGVFMEWFSSETFGTGRVENGDGEEGKSGGCRPGSRRKHSIETDRTSAWGRCARTGDSNRKRRRIAAVQGPSALALGRPGRDGVGLFVLLTPKRTQVGLFRLKPGLRTGGR
jgi:hypothetical protein